MAQHEEVHFRYVAGVHKTHKSDGLQSIYDNTKVNNDQVKRVDGAHNEMAFGAKTASERELASGNEPRRYRLSQNGNLPISHRSVAIEPYLTKRDK